MTRIEVVGPGCRRCEELERTVREVLAGSGLDAQLRRVTDPTEIVARGFFMRTALADCGACFTVSKESVS